jgi:hypothetical protein
MDITALASALVDSRAGQIQLGFAQKMLAMNVDAGRSAVSLIDAAQQNIDRLANVAAGIGTNVDMTA